MDEADHAKNYERYHRQLSMLSLAAYNRNPHADKPLIIDGRVCCVDCREPIDLERLKKRPESVRCVPCKSAYERANPYVPPFANEKGLGRVRRY